MRANRGKDTKPEVRVRTFLHALGYRFRLHRQDLPGTPDIVFPGRRKAIQVNGCFWHQHPGCQHAIIPVTRRNYWGPKLARNVQRDRNNAAKLRSLGWRLAIVWECRLKADPDREIQRLQAFLEREDG
jgi:DNA mismatch endonuclease Vsr